MKKNILGIVVVLGSAILIGCGATSNTTPTTNTSKDSAVTDESSVKATESETINSNKEQQKDSLSRLREINKEVLKIQAAKNLSKEEKADKLKALQLEIREVTNEATKK